MSSTDPVTAVSDLDEEGFGRELRVGLVMYGGVSLAIYINGVAREFFEAVRGRGVYGLLKHLIDSDVVVDIISGASAGGINGVFLAYALANKHEFAGLADLWREHADIARLLRPIGTSAPESLFQSEEYYQPKLEQAFARRDAPVHATEVPSPQEALDLFVVGTDYHGERRFREDGLGNLLTSKTYRKVFRLRHREGRPDSDLLAPSGAAGRAAQENTDQHQRALATLCRITSAFPAALAPVHVPEPKRGDQPAAQNGRVTWPEHVRQWGTLERESYFIDGGVLDNKPFTDVIERIYYRTAVRPVDRKVFYVEPDPEQFAQIEKPERPTFAGVIASSLLAIPRYESIASDLAHIEERNERLARYDEVARSVMAGNGPAGAADGYWVCRARQFVEPLRESVGTSRLAPREGRGGDIVAAGRRMIDLLPVWLSAADQRHRFVRHDVEHSLRRLFFVSYQLRDAIFARGVDQEHQRIGKKLRFALTRHLQVLKLLSASLVSFHRDHTDRLLAAVPAGATDPEAEALAVEKLATMIDRALSVVFDAREHGEAEAGWSSFLAESALPPPDATPLVWASYMPDTAIEMLKYVLRDRCGAIVVDRAAGPAPSILETLQRRTDQLLEAFRSASDQCAIASDRWARFASIDIQLFPIELLGGLREKDAIETIRVSPADAQLAYSHRTAAEKVSGDALGHFGGFLKKSWRTNDILWGRLDARCLLIEALLDHKRVSTALAAPSTRARLRGELDRTYGEAWTKAVFPEAAGADHGRIGRWLDQLLGADDRVSAAAVEELRVPRSDPKSIIHTVVRASQVSVLAEDLPDALADAGLRGPRARSAEALAKYFEKSYRVGSETPLDNIAPRTLLRTATHTGLVARNAFVGSIKASASLRARLLTPVRKAIGVPLWIGYWFATITRWRELRITAAILCALLLVIAYAWPVVLRGPGANGNDPISSVWVGLFVVGPATWLLFEMIGFLLRVRRWGGVLAALFLLASVWAVATGRLHLRSPLVWGDHSSE